MLSPRDKIVAILSHNSFLGHICDAFATKLDRGDGNSDSEKKKINWFNMHTVEE